MSCFKLKAKGFFRFILWCVLFGSLGWMARPLSQRFESWREAQASQAELSAQWQAAVARNSGPKTSQQGEINQGAVASLDATGGEPSSWGPDAPPKLSKPALAMALTVSKPHAPPHVPAVPNAGTIHFPVATGGSIWPLTRIVCDAMRLDAMVVQGVSMRALARGPGHDPQTSPPGGANCVIAAHRNMAGWWFYHLGRLRAGDQILLETPCQGYRYRVETLATVPGDDLAPLLPRGAGRPLLTLYSCTLPKTTRRLVATALLESGS